MPRSRINGNFIDRTFSIVANILLGIIPTTSGEKKAFTYYRDEPSIDPFNRVSSIDAISDASIVNLSIKRKIRPGLIHTSNGEHTKALEYYFRALERNPFLPQAFNNMAVICHYAILEGDSEIAEAWFNQAAEYWKQAIALTPDNYIEARNWLKITKRFELE
ncbi:hypothetical protein LUZ61_023097 [Rhynchospora tenuis]|nr:hypothetical protein LUZ61_023097 [Rhynchospora tenuis]